MVIGNHGVAAASTERAVCTVIHKGDVTGGCGYWRTSADPQTFCLRIRIPGCFAMHYR